MKKTTATSPSHAATPWSYQPSTKTIRSRSNHWIATVDSFDGAVDNEANARRIVACVNACEGTDPVDVPNYREAIVNMVAGIDEMLDAEDLTIDSSLGDLLLQIVNIGNAALFHEPNDGDRCPCSGALTE
jgi:hypothetical protein